MTEMERLHSALEAQLREAEIESITLRERVRLLTYIRAQARQAIDREGVAAKSNDPPAPSN